MRDSSARVTQGPPTATQLRDRTVRNSITRRSHRTSERGCTGLGRYRCSAIRLVDRLRHGARSAALLIAVLLVVAVVDCSPAREHSHADSHHPMTAVATTALPHHPVDALTTAAHCDVHATHCSVESIPPATVSLTLSALLLAAFTAVLSAAPKPPAGGVGARGPPRRPRSTSGRTILTLHCIARR